MSLGNSLLLAQKFNFYLAPENANLVLQVGYVLLLNIASASSEFDLTKGRTD